MKYFVFDVESAGLNGDGFAVGYAIVDDESGSTLESDWRSAGLHSVTCRSDDWKWLSDNLPSEVLSPAAPYLLTLDGLRDWFSTVVEKNKDCAPCADCAIPVEAKWLSQCGLNPYPMHEVATLLLAAGLDPIGTFERLPYELPKHHPMHDARQSGRILLECLATIRGREYPPMCATPRPDSAAAAERLWPVKATRTNP